jgi:hypothetical protein
MQLTGNIGETWGRWTIDANNGIFITARCSCGVTRTVRRNYWTAASRMSIYCRQCAIEVEKNRLTKFIFHRTTA